MEKEFTFVVVLSGKGKDRDEAWEDAVACFTQDPGSTPEENEKSFLVYDIQDILETLTGRILRTLPDPEKLRTLANWFDMEQERHGKERGWTETEVQKDLRKWAQAISDIRNYVYGIRAAQKEGKTQKKFKGERS